MSPTDTIRLTWKGAAQIIAAGLQDGNAEGQRLAKAELVKMAQAADLAIEQERVIAQMQARIASLEQQRNLGITVVERFLAIDDWTDELIAPAVLITEARELVAVARKAGVKS